MPVENQTKGYDPAVGEVVEIAPFDPRDVDPHTPGQALSEAPQAPTSGTDSQAAEAPEDEEPLPEFDPQVALEFEGLLFVGALSKEFTWAGHKFSIRTLMSHELLEVALLHRKWAESIGAPKAYTTAMVAACVSKVDGKPIPTAGIDEPLQEKFNYVSRWFAPTIDAIYEQYLLLESLVNRVIDAMGKATG